MDAALIGLAGVLIGVIGGYVTARATARSNAEQLNANRIAERESDRRQMALELARLEVERNPDGPYSPAEYATVLMDQLRQLDVKTDAGDGDSAVEDFRAAFCERCGAFVEFDADSGPALCSLCRDQATT